jgi:hypothetical protein
VRDDVATLVALAVTLPGVDAAAVIEVQLAAAQARAAALRGEDSKPADDAVAASIVRSARAAAADAEVTWLDAALTRVRAEGTAAGELALDTVAPRRGRPRLGTQ